MIKKVLIIVLLVIAAIAVLCYAFNDQIMDAISRATQKKKAKISQEANMAEYKRIDAQEAYKLMQSGEYIVLDVRSEGEYAQGHIKGAINHPLQNIENIAESIENKDAKVLVYCHSGQRSANASRQMIDMGYTNVYDFGGIISWPYEIEK